MREGGGALTLPSDTVLMAGGMTDDVARAAAGDVSAFERVYRTHLPRVHSLVRRMAGGRDTDELTQDVFVRVWQKLGSFRGDSAFSTWLHRLAVNVVIERFRTDTARRQRLLDGEDIFETLAGAVAIARPVDGLRDGADEAARRRARDLRAARRRGLQAPRDRDAAGDFRRHVEGPAAPRADDAAASPAAGRYVAQAFRLARAKNDMTTDPFTDRLSEYVDDELDARERASVEAHLAGCAECRRRSTSCARSSARAGALRRFHAAAGSVAGDRGADRRAGGSSPRVSLFRRAMPARRFSFTLPQLAAAGLALMVLSGGLVWMARSGDPRADFDPISAHVEAPEGDAPAVRPANFADALRRGDRGPRADARGRTHDARSRNGSRARGEPRRHRSRDRPVPPRAGGRSGQRLSEHPPGERAAAKARAPPPRQRAGVDGRLTGSGLGSAKREAGSGSGSGKLEAGYDADL